MTVTETGSIVRLHCVTWEWGRQETYLLLISNILYYHSTAGTLAGTNFERTHTHTSSSCARQFRHFKAFNLCTKQMAGGGKLEGEPGCFFRGTGSISEKPLISHNPAKSNTQTTLHHTACCSLFTLQNRKCIAVTDRIVLNMTKDVFNHFLTISASSFEWVLGCQSTLTKAKVAQE